MEDYFVKLPNKLFYNDNKEEKSILQETGDYKTILVLNYLYTNTNRRGISIFTLENLIVSCGYKLDNHKNKANEQFLNILVKLQKLGITITDIDLSKIKPKDFVICKLNIFEKDKDNKDIKFILLFDSEKDKILSFDKEKVDNIKLLNYFCYIKCRMYKREGNKPIFLSHGKAEVCYPSFKKISEDLGLSDETIAKYNKILVDLDLIRIGNLGLYYNKADKNKVLRENPNLYVLFDKFGNWKEELSEGLKQYKLAFADSRVFIGKGYKNNSKVINGFIGRIESLEEQGKATAEQIEKKNRLKDARDNSKKFEILSLLEANRGKTLGDILLDKDSRKADFVCELEENLGLVNESGELKVPYNFYVDKIISEIAI